MHDFDERLAFSHAQSDLALWETIYRQAFPDFSTMHDVRADGWAQRGGIDRQVILAGGKVLAIDEKTREKDYGDIWLEHAHQYRGSARRTPGWVNKDLACDFIAYAFLPSRRCYLLPFQQLRRAWVDHGRAWWSRYPTKKAPNREYDTLGVCVPIDVVIAALSAALVVDWAPVEPSPEDADQWWEDNERAQPPLL